MKTQERSMELGEERVVRVAPGTSGVIGSVRRTLGGFYRAYSSRCGLGLGPFFSEAAAEEWVRSRQAVPRYWRGA